MTQWCNWEDIWLINPVRIHIQPRFGFIWQIEYNSDVIWRHCVYVFSVLFCTFLPRDAMISVVYAVVVCVSVWRRYCIKMAKCRIMQIMPHDSPGTLVFWHQRSRQNSNGITPYGGDKCRWVGKNRALSTNKSKMVQDRRIVSVKVE